MSQGMMITLTYDTYKYDSRGNIIGENVPNKDLHVSKAHAQRFIKRLRWIFPDKDIKYILTAEYGKKTHRAHYHALVFGMCFDDLRHYKKSKRGNVIYKSPTLEKIWSGDKEHNGGICTVDCINPSVAVARYCTKYCAKDSGVDDTFMLFSHGIGETMLRKLFNGKNYILDGKEFPVPRSVWQWYIREKYNLSADYTRYVNYPSKYDRNGFIKKTYQKPKSHAELFLKREKYFRSARLREQYSTIRDNFPAYQEYLAYWKSKIDLHKKYEKPVFDRILALPDDKYWSYKQKSLRCYTTIQRGIQYTPPRSNAYCFDRGGAFEKGLLSKTGYTIAEKVKFFREIVKTRKKQGHLPCASRHITANDSKKAKTFIKNGQVVVLGAPKPFKIGEENPFLE